jgi:HEPN domain-containing protein
LSARSPRDLADILLRRAQDDATAVAEFGANPRIADSVIGLHAQQAIEKSLKAVMALRELGVPRTHDLDLLAERIQADGIRLPVDRDQLADLTAYAGPLRYDEVLDAEPLDRDAVRTLVDDVGRWAETECSG